MKLQVNAEIDGGELLKYFLQELKNNNIDAPWKEGDKLPVGVKLQVWSEKGQKFIDFDPVHVKFTYNK